MAKSTRGRLPKIIVSEEEYERLSGLASSIAARNPELAEALQDEMERAKVVSSGKVPPGIVRMNSLVEFESDDGQRRRVTLVYPGDADISAGRISILTPIGTALIGLAEGQSISWTARDGREQQLTILSVTQEADIKEQEKSESPVINLENIRAVRASKMLDDDPGPSAA